MQYSNDQIIILLQNYNSITDFLSIITHFFEILVTADGGYILIFIFSFLSFAFLQCKQKNELKLYTQNHPSSRIFLFLLFVLFSSLYFLPIYKEASNFLITS